MSARPNRSPHVKFRTLSEPEVEVEEEEVAEEVVPEEEEVAEEVVPEEEEEPLESSAATTESGDYEEKPVQVSKPSATNITHNSARIEWKKARRAEEYIVTRRALYADNPESSLSPVHTTSGLSYDDTDLVPDTEYIYRIVARNNVGEAQRSSHLKFRTLSEPVGIVISAELVGPEEPESEFIPEEEEEPLEADAAHVEVGSCETPGKVGDLQVTNGFNGDGDPIVRVEWDHAENADIYRVDRLNTTDPDLDPDGVASPVTLEEFPETNSYEDGDISPNTTYVYRVYPSHKCLIDEDGYYPWSRGARSHSVFITTPDFPGSAFSPPTPGCPKNRRNDDDKSNDYPRDISTCGVILTEGESFGTLESRSDHDWYRLDFEEGRWQVYAFMEMAADDGRPVVLSGLYDHNGRKLPGWRNFSQNTGPYQNNTAAEFTVKRGTYFIDVHSAGFYMGDYTVYISELVED